MLLQFRAEPQRRRTCGQRPRLGLCIEPQLIDNRGSERLLESLPVRTLSEIPRRLVAQVRLENACRAHRQEIFVNDWLDLNIASLQKSLDRAWKRGAACVAQAFGRRRIAEEAELFGTQRGVVSREGLEMAPELFRISCGVRAIACERRRGARGGEKPIVKSPASGRQREAALLDLAKARGVHAALTRVIRSLEGDRLLKRLEARLTQEDRAVATRRTLDNRLRVHVGSGHRKLGRVNVERAQCQMVDVRPHEANDVGNQRMRLVKLVIDRRRDGRFAAPAEGLDRLADKFARPRLVESTFRLEHAEKLPTTLRKNIAPGKDRRGLPPQFDILDQVQAEQ